MTDNFWYNNISILYDKNYILEIIPNRDYDLNRKLNAFVKIKYNLWNSIIFIYK